MIRMRSHCIWDNIPDQNRDTFCSLKALNCVSLGKSDICQEIPTKGSVIVNEDHRESSQSHTETFWMTSEPVTLIWD